MAALALITSLNDKQHPFEFVQAMCKHFGAKTDVQLAYILKMPKCMISKMRCGLISITGSHLLRFYEFSGLSIETLLELLYQRKFEIPRPPQRLAEAVWFEEGRGKTLPPAPKRVKPVRTTNGMRGKAKQAQTTLNWAAK